MLFGSLKKRSILLSLTLMVAIFTGLILHGQLSKVNQYSSYIISAKDHAKLTEILTAHNINITHQLPIIDAVAVDLTESELTSISALIPIKASINHKVVLADKGWRKGQRRWQPNSVVPEFIGATSAHQNYNFGDGVTIGFLDTGLDQLSGLSTDLYGKDKAWGTYDAINNTVHNYDDEANGHGTHVASVAGNSDYDINGRIYGVAPNAAILGIKAFDHEGKATYADVIRGIDWALQVKDQVNLRILNMSFSGAVRSNYWDDPLNQAVMKAWQAGLVVIASAGNTGPDPMTIGVPGNVPYIITVGAVTDSYTSTDSGDDKIATFSAAGPTVEGFVKPEIVAPGGHLSGLMSFDSALVVEHPEFHDGGRYFEMSGTSQAAAVVSGVVALMLTENPALTPDEVKCRLMDSAKTAYSDNGSIAYSVFQQGAGIVNATDALSSTATQCANQSLNIAKDIAGESHYYGPSNIDENGNFYVEGMGEEYIWNLANENLAGDVLIWKNNFETDVLIWKNSATTDVLIWKNSFETDVLIWKNNVETDVLIWKNNFSGSEVATIGINSWVEQQ